MKRPKAHVIGSVAETIFRSLLPGVWIVSKFEAEKDYAKDFSVEIADEFNGTNDNVTGKIFYVQLKGQENVQVHHDKGYVQFSLENDHATYFLDKVTHAPVFLVVLDITTKEAWWLFLQDYLAQDQSWRTKQKFKVRIPLANKLADTALLETAVGNAIVKIRQMHPMAIQDSIQAHKDFVRNLDSRFEPSISVHNDKVTCHLTPTCPVPVKFTFRSSSEEEARKKMHDLIGRGMEVHFSAGELSASGSPLFETLVSSDVILQLSKNAPATISLCTRDEEKNELGRLNHINGRMTGGNAELRFNGGIENSPFNIAIGPIMSPHPGNISLTTKFSVWDHRPISQLQWFDQLAALFVTLDTASSLDVEYFKDGNLVTVIPYPIKRQPTSFAGLAEYIRAIQSARRLCRHLGIDPTWTIKSFDEDTIEIVEQLHDVTFLGKYCRPTPNRCVTVPYSKASIDSFFEKVGTVHAPTEFTLDGEVTYDVLGNKVTRHLKQLYTHMVVGKPTRLKRDKYSLPFQGNKDTVLTVEESKDVGG